MTLRSGPKRTGTIEACKRADGTKYFRARIRLADGSRERVNVPEKHAYSEERAKHYAQAVQEKEERTGEMLAAKVAREAQKAAESDPRHGETWAKWFDRYLPAKECSEGYRAGSSRVEGKWIRPIIGAKPIAKLTRDDIEDVRDRLDRAIDSKEIRPATAANTWGIFTGALKAAYAARDRSLRVLASPLHFGMLPPKKGPSRQRPWLYPREWTRFAECGAVPIEWRQLCALALYTGLRPGELHALTWGSDVDLDARTISVSKAVDAATKRVKAPKTAAGQRVIPIHPELVPLLEALRGAPEAKVTSFIVLHGEKAGRSFRQYLAEAGIDRPRLTADTETEEPVDFRSLRDTHATWLALEGISDKIIQRRMGHASPTTTDRYVKAAETFAVDNVGAPFPALPTSLTSIGPQSGHGRSVSPKFTGKTAPAVGLEPTTRRLTAACSTN